VRTIHKRNWFIVIGLVVAVIGYGLHNYPQLPTNPTTASVQAAPVPEQSLFTLVNLERTSRGLQPLQEVAELGASAGEKCADMVNRDYWAHVAPDGTRPENIINKYLQARLIGENLTEGYDNNPKLVNQAWMNSPEHKANILNPTYTRVGYAICQDGIQPYTVQHFASE